MQTKPEDVMPWKVNGERWHLGEKGFPIGRKVHWDRAILPRLIALVKEVAPEVQIEWDARAAITLHSPRGPGPKMTTLSPDRVPASAPAQRTAPPRAFQSEATPVGR